MAANTPHEWIGEIDGLWFRVQKLRGRRAFRGTRALQTTLGPQGYLMVTSPKFWEADPEAQLTAIMQIESRTGSSYDEGELAMSELLAFSGDAGGQGVCYRDTDPDRADDPSKGWVPIRSMTTLDRYASVDHITWQALRWEMIKLCYRPTSAASGMSPDTAAATTSTQGSGSSGSPAKQPSGAQAATRPLGMSGG